MWRSRGESTRQVYPRRKEYAVRGRVLFTIQLAMGRMSRVTAENAYSAAASTKQQLGYIAWVLYSRRAKFTVTCSNVMVEKKFAPISL
jgi:hypothetical protein